MQAKLVALMDSYVKNSEVEMLYSVFSENELGDFFKEKWEMLKDKKIVDIQAFKLWTLNLFGVVANRIKE